MRHLQQRARRHRTRIVPLVLLCLLAFAPEASLSTSVPAANECRMSCCKGKAQAKSCCQRRGHAAISKPGPLAWRGLPGCFADYGKAPSAPAPTLFSIKPSHNRTFISTSGRHEPWSPFKPGPPRPNFALRSCSGLLLLLPPSDKASLKRRTRSFIRSKAES